MASEYQGFDDQTEVLTADGWIKFKDLDTDYQVMTLVDGNLVYENPSSISKNDYVGPMHRFKGPNVDLLVTPYHKMWVSKRGFSDFGMETPTDIANQSRNFELDISSQYDAEEDQKYFILPAYAHYPARRLDMKDWLMFYGTAVVRCLLIGEYVALVLESDKRNILETTCKTLGFDVRHGEDNSGLLLIDDLPLYNYLSKSSGALDEWVWSLSEYQADELLDNIMCAGPDHETDGGWVLKSQNRELIDSVHRLTVHAGLITIAGKEGQQHQLRVVHSDDISAAAKLTEITNYEGIVYNCCVSSGIVCVRRNGIIGFCGSA